MRLGRTPDRLREQAVEHLRHLRDEFPSSPYPERGSHDYLAWVPVGSTIAFGGAGAWLVDARSGRVRALITNESRVFL